MGDGPPGFPQGFSCPAVLRVPLRVRLVFAYVAITLSGRSFQTASANQRIGNSTVADPTTPSPARETRSTDYADFTDSKKKPLLPFPSLLCNLRNLWMMFPVQRWVWARPISLAATLGIAVAFSSSRY